MKQDAADDIYALTRKGQLELQAGLTDLSPLEIQLLVRVDGLLTLEQIWQGLGCDLPAFLGAFSPLLRRQLVEPVQTDPVGAAMQAAVRALGGGLTEVEAGVASLERSGFFVRIAQERKSARVLTPGERLHVLIVEDNPHISGFLETFLQMEGFVVRLASDRASVLAQLSKRPVPDVVLLDGGLPDVDGFAILEKLVQHPTFKHVPVIMLTGFDTRAAVIRGISAGAAGYLTKPVDPDLLLRAVRAVLGIPQPRAEESAWPDPTRRAAQ